MKWVPSKRKDRSKNRVETVLCSNNDITHFKTITADLLRFHRKNVVLQKQSDSENEPNKAKHAWNAETASEGERGAVTYGDAAHALCRIHLHSESDRPCLIRPSSFSKSCMKSHEGH